MTTRPTDMSGDFVRVVVPSARVHAADAIHQLMSMVAANGYSETCCFAVRLALEEAVSNAIRHGNRNDPGKDIVFEYAVTPDVIAIDVEDEGSGFDPARVPDPTLDENIERPCGRGIMLMRAYMTELSYNDKGNRVRLRFRCAD